ncbi:hypothetical protein NSX55_24590, partial [Salmonella enterica]|nr:hypothetical protein [Salmonella enterica]
EVLEVAGQNRQKSVLNRKQHFRGHQSLLYLIDRKPSEWRDWLQEVSQRLLKWRPLVVVPALVRCLIMFLVQAI